MHPTSQPISLLQHPDIPAALVTLGLAGTMIVLLAWLAAGRFQAAWHRRAVWQVALVGMAALVVMELVGAGGAVSGWINNQGEENHSVAATVNEFEELAHEPASEINHPADVEWHAQEERNPLATFPLPFQTHGSLWAPFGGAEFFTGLMPAPGDWRFSPPGATGLSLPEPFGFDLYVSDIAEASSNQELEGALLEDTGATETSESGAGDALLANDLFADAAGPSGVTPAANSNAKPPHSDSHARDSIAMLAAPWLGFAWLIGGSILLLRTIGGRVLLGLLSRRLEECANCSLADAAAEVAGQLGYRRRIHIRMSESLAGPLAFGLFRPTLALPRKFTRHFTPQGQKAVLAHEIAHLQQADPLWLLLGEMLTACLWWHPAAWICRQRLTAESEHAADEATLALDDGPAHLATSLLRQGARLSRPRALGFVAAVGSGRRSNLSRRIERLVDLEESPMRPRRKRPFVKALAVSLVIAGCMFGTAWARPGLPSGGERNVNMLKNSWRTSFAGAALAAVMATSPAIAQDADSPPNPGASAVDRAEETAAQEQEVARIAEEIAALHTVNQELASKLETSFASVTQDMEAEQELLSVQAEQAKTELAELAKRVEAAQAAGEMEAARAAAAELASVRASLDVEAAELSQRRAAVRARFEQEAQSERNEIRRRVDALEARLAEMRAQGRAATADRLQDRLAMLRRETEQGAARRRAAEDAATADQARVRRRVVEDAATADQARVRRRADQEAATADQAGVRRRAVQDAGELEEKIAHIMAAAENLEAAGLLDQASELRAMARELRAAGRATRRDAPANPGAGIGPRVRTGRPGAGPGRGGPGQGPGAGGPDAQPPRNPPGGGARRRAAEDAPRPTLRQRARVAPAGGGAGDPEAAPVQRRRAAGESADAALAAGRRAGPASPVDRELINLIRSLQSEVESLRSEVQALRQEMDGGPGAGAGPARRRAPARVRAGGGAREETPTADSAGPTSPGDNQERSARASSSGADPGQADAEKRDDATADGPPNPGAGRR